MFQHVCEFANVAGPVMRLQQFDGVRRQHFWRNTFTLQVPSDQMQGQAWNVIETFAKRRQVDFERIDSEEQVFAKRSFGNHLLKFTIRRTDDTNVDVKRFVVTHTSHFAGLEESQQFDLHGFIEFPKFVEEQRPVVGDFEEPCPFESAPVKAPFRCPKNSLSTSFQESLRS